jgi:hypothetical protein
MQINLVALPSVYANLWFKQFFEKAAASRKPLCRFAVNSASCELPDAASADCYCSSW